MNIFRVWTITINVFLEVVRDRILYLIGFFAVIMILIWRLLPEVSASTQDKILLDFGLGFITILSVVVTVFIGTGLINKEIEKRTILVLIPKPISPSEFIIGKHLGLSAVIAVLVLSMTVIYFIILGFGRISFPMGSILLSVVYLLIELSLLTAVALLFGVFTSSLLATILTFAVYLGGHLSPDLVRLGEISKNSSIQQITDNLYLVLPDLSRLDLKNLAVYGALPSPIELIENAVYGLIYTLLLLMITIVIFSRREF